MVILLTNDDGILSPGLTALRDVFRGKTPFWVVAPERERSAIGHAITITDPLRVQVLSDTPKEKMVAVSGTPADCVKLAIGSLMPKPPAVVIAGINPGPNVGINVIYSGTVSAALEGAIFGIPSVAVSVAEDRPDLYLTAAAFTARLVDLLTSKRRLPEGFLLNLNFPDCPPDEIRGVRVTVQGHSRYRDTFERRTDPRGKIYYWLAGERKEPDPTPNSDETALEEGYISLTPVQADLTASSFIDELRSWPLADFFWPPSENGKGRGSKK